MTSLDAPMIASTSRPTGSADRRSYRQTPVVQAVPSGQWVGLPPSPHLPAPSHVRTGIRSLPLSLQPVPTSPLEEPKKPSDAEANKPKSSTFDVSNAAGRGQDTELGEIR